MIRQKNICFILLFLVLLSSACQSQLPKEVPNNLEISFEDHTGKTLYPNGPPASFLRRASLSGNQMTVEMARCPKVEKIILTNEEIKSLYKKFIEAEFDLMKDDISTDNGYDGFWEIYLQAGNITKKVRQS